MSSYTSGNKAPTLERQHAVKVGNMDGKKPSHKGGATDVVIKKGGTSYAPGHQAAPKVAPFDGKNSGVTEGRRQKVQLHKPHEDYAVRKTQAYMEGANKAVKR